MFTEMGNNGNLTGFIAEALLKEATLSNNIDHLVHTSAITE
jgi:hypothetical protein